MAVSLIHSCVRMICVCCVCCLCFFLIDDLAMIIYDSSPLFVFSIILYPPIYYTTLEILFFYIIIITIINNIIIRVFINVIRD